MHPTTWSEFCFQTWVGAQKFEVNTWRLKNIIEDWLCNYLWYILKVENWLVIQAIDWGPTLKFSLIIKHNAHSPPTLGTCDLQKYKYREITIIIKFIGRPKQESQQYNHNNCQIGNWKIEQT